MRTALKLSLFVSVCCLSSFLFPQQCFALSNKGSIVGTVVEEESGLPLANAMVDIRQLAGEYLGGRQLHTDAAGKFRADNLPVGRYGDWAVLNGYGAGPYYLNVVSDQETPVTIRMTRNPGWIYGTIKDPDGKPVKGVNVEIKDGWDALVTGTSTDDAGNYKMTGLGAFDQYIVYIHEATYYGTSYDHEEIGNIVVTKGNGTQVKDIILRKTAKVYGSVKDINGNPVKDVKITCKEKDILDIMEDPLNWQNNQPQNTTTDPTTKLYRDYRANYFTPGRTYTLIAVPAAGSGFLAQAQTINIPMLGTYTLNFVLQRGGITISGILRDSATSAPAIAAQVDYRSQDGVFSYQTRPDSQGRFTFSNLSPGQATISVYPDILYARQSITQTFTQDTSVNFSLTPEISFTGFVKDTDTRLPIANVNVACGVNGNMNSVTTDAAGKFFFTGLATGTIIVRVTPPLNPLGDGYIGTELTLALTAATAPLELLLKKGVLTTISVKDAGATQAGVPAVRVKASNENSDEWSGETDVNGVFQTRLPMPGTYKIHLNSDPGQSTWIALAQTITLNSLSDKRSVALLAYNASTAGNLSGNVVVTAGKNPDSAFIVCAFQKGEAFNRIAMRDINPLNMYAFAPSANGGSYSLLAPPNSFIDLYLAALAQQGQDGAMSVTFHDKSLNVRAPAPGKTAAAPALSYFAPGITLTGKASFKNTPAIKAMVSIENTAGTLLGFANTDPAGNYIFYNTPKGILYLSAWLKDAGESRRLAVNTATTSGSINKDLVIVETGNVQGIVTTRELRRTGNKLISAITPVTGAAIIFTDDPARNTLTTTNGVYKVSHLPAGSYKILVSKPGFKPQTATVTVPAKGTITQNFLLEAFPIH